MKRYRDDKLYVVALFGWGVMISQADGWWTVAAIVGALCHIVLHQMAGRAARIRKAQESPEVVGLDPNDPMAMVVRAAWSTGKVVTWNERDGLRTFDDPRDPPVTP